MTLAEVAEKKMADARAASAEWPDGRDSFVRDGLYTAVEITVAAFKADPDFNAGPELRRIRERLEKLLATLDAFPGSYDTALMARRLREILDPEKKE